MDLADQVISSSFANGVSSVFDYDVNGRMTHMERFKNGAPPTMLVEYDYGHDAVGNRLYTRDLMATDRSELYEHDSRNRLRNFERGTLNTAGDDITTPLVDPVLPSQQQWTDLDRRGNWLDFSTTLNGQPAVQQTRTVNGVNEVLTLDPDGSGAQSAMTLANDPNGNLTENPWTFNADDSGTPTGQKYEYDEENRLVRVRRLTNNETLLEISYDALGRRVESKEYLDAQVGMLPTARVTRHVVLGAMTIEEHVFTEGSGWALAREFVWGTEYPMPVAIIDYTAAGQVGAGQPEVLHYLRDVLGNVVALANADGNVVERYRYDPYGMTHIYNAGGMPLPTSAYGNPFAFTGQRYDAAVVLYHFWFRTYSPTLGRWHQRDLLGYFDGLSLYQYVLSSPAMRVDPFGLWSIFRWLYTGDPNAPDYVYRAAVDAAASWLWRNSPVRGGFVEAEYETRYGQIVGEASWSMDSGFGGFGGFQVGNSQRRRGWTGAVPFSRLPGPLYQSDTLGLEGGLCWSEEDGLTVCTEVSRSIGMSGSTYAGSVFLGWDPSSNWIEIGISRGPISAGLSIDPSKIDDYVESVFGDGDDSGDDFGSCPAE